MSPWPWLDNHRCNRNICSLCAQEERIWGGASIWNVSNSVQKDACAQPDKECRHRDGANGAYKRVNTSYASYEPVRIAYIEPHVVTERNQA